MKTYVAVVVVVVFVGGEAWHAYCLEPVMPHVEFSSTCSWSVTSAAV